jgi:hypothetical protein
MSGFRNARETVMALTPATRATSSSVDLLLCRTKVDFSRKKDGQIDNIDSAVIYGTFSND